MNAIEWLDKQVEMLEEQMMHRKLSEEICAITPERRIWVKGIEELAKAAGKVVRLGYEDEELYEEFFTYKGIRFCEGKRKDGK